MIVHKVAHRYSKSLLHLAIEQNLVEEVKADMDLILVFNHASSDFKTLLKSPVVRRDLKKKSLDKVFSNELCAISDNFIDVLLRKNREYLLAEIAESFVARYNEYKDIVVAKVTTAVPLNDENEKEIIALVHKMKKGNVQIEEVIDPELIGGFIVRVGDMQIDSSVIRELNVMRREMNENPYIAEL